MAPEVTCRERKIILLSKPILFKLFFSTLTHCWGLVWNLIAMVLISPFSLRNRPSCSQGHHEPTLAGSGHSSWSPWSLVDWTTSVDDSQLDHSHWSQSREHRNLNQEKEVKLQVMCNTMQVIVMRLSRVYSIPPLGILLFSVWYNSFKSQIKLLSGVMVRPENVPYIWWEKLKRCARLAHYYYYSVHRKPLHELVFLLRMHLP